MKNLTEAKQIWKPKKLKKVNPKQVISEVYHHGTMVGGTPQERPPVMILPPLGWKPWVGE